MRDLTVKALCLGGALAIASSVTQAAMIEVEFENTSPTGGVFFTPLWVGFHNGGFDTFDVGSAASSELERLAEDGSAMPLGAALTAGQSSAIGSVITSPGGFPGAPVFDPGESASAVFNLDATDNRFLSFASMLIPSNDGFIGNDDPLELFNISGDFVGDIVLSFFGSDVLDAGTEDNTELAAAFLNQTAPDQGTATIGGSISSHPGFLASGNILGGTNGFATFDPVLADFARNGGINEIARITISQVTEVSEPASAALMLLGVAGLVAGRKRLKKA